MSTPVENLNADPQVQEGFKKSDSKKNGPITDSVQHLELGLILPNPNQPRKDFTSERAKESLTGLASSIRKEGVIQPIIVTPLLTREFAEVAIPADKLPEGKTHADYVGKHLIIAGQRRWMASGIASKKWIPSIVRDIKLDDVASLIITSATENLAREDMTVYEEAMVYKYHEDQGWSHANIATQYGKHRTHVANLLGLLDLPKEVVDALASNDSGVTMGHARWLKALKGNDEIILALLKRVQEDGVSVRWIEEQVKEAQSKLKAAEVSTEEITGDIDQAPKASPTATQVAPTPVGDGSAPSVVNITNAPAAEQNIIVSDEIVAAIKSAKNSIKTGVRYIPGEPEGKLEIQVFGMADLARILKVLGVPAEVADAVNK